MGAKAVVIACAAGCAGGGDQARQQRILEELEREGVILFQADDSSGAGDAGTQPTLPANGPITLADLLAVAEARNPSLAAARSEIGMSAGQVWQASLYPNPSVEISSEEIPFRSGIDEGVMVLSATQPIVLGDRLDAAVAAAEADEAARRAEVEVRIREIFGEIAQLHARLLANRQARALYEQLAELGAQTLNMAQLRFEARAAPETDVIRPQIELHQIEVARARLAVEEAGALEQLSLLLGGFEVDVERLEGTIPENPDALALGELATIVRNGHPALVAADREIDAAEAQLERIRAERLPDLDVRVGAGYAGESDEAIFEVGAGMVLPIWDEREGDILSARFEIVRARQGRLAVENDLLQQLAEAHADYEAARVQLATVRDQIVPAALRSFDLIMAAHRGGRADFLEVIDAQRTLMEARTMLIDLMGDAAAARARILQITGPLEEHTRPESNVQGSSLNSNDAPDGAENIQ
jgi:cobalt-zinc-cadmium efflux system outer membrane protein